MSSSTFSSSSSVVMWTGVCWLMACILLVNTQMTFSDGWGKRSGMIKEVHPRSLAGNSEANFATAVGESQKEADKAIVNAALDVCHTAYSQSLVQLHQQIMAPCYISLDHWRQQVVCNLVDNKLQHGPGFPFSNHDLEDGVFYLLPDKFDNLLSFDLSEEEATGFYNRDKEEEAIIVNENEEEAMNCYQEVDIEITTNENTVDNVN